MGAQLPSPKRGHSPPPILCPFLLSPNSRKYHDATWYGGRFQLRRLCVRRGTQPPPQKGRSPSAIFGLCYCGQTAAWIKMPLVTEVGLGSDDIVLNGDPAPTPHKGGRAPQFSAHFYCGQAAGCIKMPLGMEVGLSRGNFVVD